MKKLFSLLVLLLATSCGINEMSSNIDESNQLLKQNIATMTEARKGILENTKEVKRSTATTLALSGGLEMVHPILIPVLFILFIALLLAPLFILLKLTKKIIKYTDKR